MIFAGVPVNVTLLFSAEQYTAAADAYMKGLERRIVAGQAPDVRSVASVFISRWDRAVIEKVPDALRDKLGLAVGQRAYKAYRDVLDSDRWQRLSNLGARPQRLLFASTSMKDPKAPDTLYVTRLAAPNTVDTMPEATLRAFAEHGAVETNLPRDGGTPTRRWPRMQRPASTLLLWRANCSRTAPNPSSHPGRICCRRSRPKAEL